MLNSQHANRSHMAPESHRAGAARQPRSRPGFGFFFAA